LRLQAKARVSAPRVAGRPECWADLARLIAAEPALVQGWGQPRSWLEAAVAVFGRYQIEPLAARCRTLLARPQPSRWSRLGITDRQADVLRLDGR
jgi:hypothetical protein